MICPEGFQACSNSLILLERTGFFLLRGNKLIMSQCSQLKMIQIAVFKYASATIQTYNINNLTALQGSICCIEPIKTKKKLEQMENIEFNLVLFCFFKPVV